MIEHAEDHHLRGSLRLAVAALHVDACDPRTARLALAEGVERHSSDSVLHAAMEHVLHGLIATQKSFVGAAQCVPGAAGCDAARTAS